MGFGEGRWFRLNTPSIAFCIGWCALFIALGVDCLDEQLERVEELGVRIVDTYRPYSALLRFAMVPVASLSVLCYVAVSWRNPRPPQLHWHGFVLMLMVLESYMTVRIYCFDLDEQAKEIQWNNVITNCLFGIKRITLVTLTTLKIDALGPPMSCLVSIRLWGRVLNFSQGFYHFLVQQSVPLWFISMKDRGYTRQEVNALRGNVFAQEPREVDAEAIDELAAPAIAYSMTIWLCWLILVRFVYIIVATRLVWHTMQKLIDRKADTKELARVRFVLWQHVAGYWLVLVTGCASSLGRLWQTFRMHEILEWEKPMKPQPTSLGYLIDGVGDVVGALLLSGIFGLLFKEDAEGGDVSGYIRGLLHSAVLTSRGESAFEGRIILCPRNACVVSFPGKYWTEWNELTWFCELGELSSACVFLPQNDPHQRFGRHDANPEAPGQCWCYSMYGTQKPWGCAWFTAWMANVEAAVRLNLELIIVFFPQQANQGLVAWENLRHTNLWDGVGLGGSQKVEVAWLAMKGFACTSEDLSVTKQRFSRQRQRNTPSTPGVEGTRSSASGTSSRANTTHSASSLWGLVKAPRRAFTS